MVLQMDLPVRNADGRLAFGFAQLGDPSDRRLPVCLEEPDPDRLDRVVRSHLSTLLQISLPVGRDLRSVQ